MKQLINSKSDHIVIDGHRGTWYVIDTKFIKGRMLYLLEHEQYGDEAPLLIVTEYGHVTMSDVWNGFSDLENR